MEIGSNQKKLAIIMMLACVLSGVIGLTTKHWIANEEAALHASLTTTYWPEEDPPWDEETYSEGVDNFCSDPNDWADDLCDDLTALRNSGIVAIVILLVGTITGLLFMLVVYRSSNGVWDGITAAHLDYRFALGPAVSNTLAPVLWWGLSHEARGNLGDSLGWSFYLTLIGGLIGIASCVILRNADSESPVNPEEAGVESAGPFEAQAEADPSQILVEKSSLTGSEKPNQIASIIALVAIVLSLFFPYASLGIESPEGGELEVSGIEMIEYWGEIAQVISEFDPAELESEPCPYANDGECDEPFLCAEGTDGNDCGSSSGSSIPDTPLRAYMLMIGVIMFMVSPLVFLLSGISGAALAKAGTAPRLLGLIHMGFFLVLMLMVGIGGTLLSELIGENPISFMGMGLWIGGLSSIGLIYKGEE